MKFLFKASTAAFAGGLIYFLTYFPYFFLSGNARYASMTQVQKILASLLSNVAMAFVQKLCRLCILSYLYCNLRKKILLLIVGQSNALYILIITHLPVPSYSAIVLTPNAMATLLKSDAIS
jgi:hypothetical protein